MQISNTIFWQSVNWPALDAATEYAVFVNAASTPTYTTTDGVLSVAVTYDEASPGTVFIIRPTDGTNYGPSQTVVIANQPLNNRAWIRDQIRKRIADRTDTSNVVTPTISDDELNAYLNDAIRQYSMQFPVERDYTITLLAGGQMTSARDYQLPADFYKLIQVRYNQVNSNLEMYLKEASFKGGETTATSWVGYPKLGILQPPIGGRYYPGHFDVWEGAIHIDFDPLGNGDTMTVRYWALHQYPTDDITRLDLPEVDIEMILIRAEASAWLEIESKDVRLSRWRDKNDGSRRDDMPTEKMSTRLFNTWNQWVNQRRSMRPQQYRLVRR
jgi:hypothetical protein